MPPREAFQTWRRPQAKQREKERERGTGAGEGSRVVMGEALLSQAHKPAERDNTTSTLRPSKRGIIPSLWSGQSCMTHKGCTQNLKGVWNQTSRTEWPPNCSSLKLDGRDAQGNPLAEIQGKQWAPRKSGPSRASVPPSRKQEEATSLLGALFLQRPEEYQPPPSLCSISLRETAGCVSQKSFPQAHSQDPLIPKSHVLEILKVKERLGVGREGRKKDGRQIWLCLREEKQKDDPPPKKKTHKAFPFLLFVPPMCVTSRIWWQSSEC